MEVGNIFYIRGAMFRDSRFWLVQTDQNKVQLISLETSNRWNSPKDVMDVSNISDDEMNSMTKGYTWVKLDKEII